MKILGYMILHTGLPYIKYAIEAILPQVDALIILYTELPSQGYATTKPCPDTRAQLKKEAGNSVIWIDGFWDNETAHVEAITKYTGGYDWLVRLDADEVFPSGMVSEMIRQAQEKTELFKQYRIPFRHFWRSFSRVCRDGSHPVRLTRLKGGEGTCTLDSINDKYVVNHFGYAMPDKYIVYKMDVSGHRSEWRSNWYSERWQVNAKDDCHPVCFPTHWMSEEFDKQLLPDSMRSHPYFDMEFIP